LIRSVIKRIIPPTWKIPAPDLTKMVKRREQEKKGGIKKNGKNLRRMGTTY
jgi:hypothetical protein